MRTRTYRISAGAIWSIVISHNMAAAIGLVPWPPSHLNTTAVGLAVSATVIAATTTVWDRWNAPVEAAFLHGRLRALKDLDEQATTGLPQAVGGDVVIPITRGDLRPVPSPRSPSRPKHAR